MDHDFDRDATGPRDWFQALAALPVEAPPAGAWMRVATALDAPGADAPARAAWPGRARAAWLAVAATVAALAVIPLVERNDAPALPPAARTPVTAPARPAASMPAARAASDQDVPTAAREATAHAARIASADAATSAPPDRASTARRGPPPAATLPAGSDARPVASASPGDARAVPARLPAPAAAVGDAVAAQATAAPDPLQPLYAESAQLEALVALARDDRVASASGAMLTGELDSRIGTIDALLAQPGLAPDERASLWRQRVAALRQLAGVESTARWLAAHGEAFGDAFVRVD